MFKTALDSGVRWPWLDLGPVKDAVHLEMALWVRDGATPMQAIKAATAMSALTCGVDDKLGTVEVGKIADLIVVGADPRKTSTTCANSKWSSKTAAWSSIRPLDKPRQPKGASPMPAESTPSVYADLGVKRSYAPAAVSTVLGGSILSPTVRAAMEEANRIYVGMPELLDRAGASIAELIGAEAAYPTPGCFAAITWASPA